MEKIYVRLVKRVLHRSEFGRSPGRADRSGSLRQIYVGTFYIDTLSNFVFEASINGMEVDVLLRAHAAKEVSVVEA